MKVAIGAKWREGAWGGGNQFANLLHAFLEEKGVRVTRNLHDRDIDIALLMEPNPKSESTSFTHRALLPYLWFRNPACIVVHRLNNSSEARNDPQKKFNRFRVRVNRLVADHTVFISKWLHDRYVESGFLSLDHTVILNGGDTQIWKPVADHVRNDKLRIVTHHWSSNPKKGFEIYARLDDMLRQPRWGDRVDFTYIGNVPDGFTFHCADYKPVMSGEALATELGRHDIYLTAAQNEAAGMHHIEGALCGLPVLYLESGGIPEYCTGYGLGFVPETFDDQLETMINDFEAYREKMMTYPHTADRMCNAYYDLFAALISKREKLMNNRNWMKRFFGKKR